MNNHFPHDHKRRFAEFQDEDKTMPPPMLSTVRLLFGDKVEDSRGNTNAVTGIYNLDFPTSNPLTFEQQMRSKLASHLRDTSDRMSYESEFRSNTDNLSGSNLLSHSFQNNNNNNNNKNLNFDTASSGHNLHSNTYSGFLGTNRTQTTANTSHDNSISSGTSENGIKQLSRSQPVSEPSNLHAHSIKRARRRIIRNSLGSPQRLSRIELALQQHNHQLEQQNQVRDSLLDEAYYSQQLPSNSLVSSNENKKESHINLNSFRTTMQNYSAINSQSIELPHKQEAVAQDIHSNDNDSGKSLFWMSVEKNKSNSSLISISEEKHNELRKRIEERKRMDELKQLFKKESSVDQNIDQENKNGSSRGSSGGNGSDQQDRIPLGAIPNSLLNQDNDVFKKPKSKIPIPTLANTPNNLHLPAQLNLNSSLQNPITNSVPSAPNRPATHVNNFKGTVNSGLATIDSDLQSSVQNHESNNGIRAPSYSIRTQQAQTEITNSRRKALTINGVNYEKLQLIGRGGSSKVYKVLAPNNRHYAIKKVTFDQFDESSVKGFKGEIDLLKKLKNSDRVVKLIDYEVGDGLIYLVMECGDLDLATVFQNRLKTLDLEFVKYHAIEILKCVLAVHENGIVHSDLKPANFLFVKGMLKIIDFGIANAVPDHTSNIYRDSQIGTPNYMAPEALIETNLTSQQAAKTTWRVGRPSDVWSCGCIIYQMIYGKPPYGAYTGNQRIMAIMNPQVKIQYHSKGIGDAKVPQTAIKLMKKCLARDPLERWTVEQCLKSDFLHPKLVTESFVRDLVHLSINFGHSSRVNGGVISADVYDQVVETVLKQIEELNY